MIQAKICETCKKEFLPKYRVTQAYWKKRKFCSDACSAIGLRGTERSSKGVVKVPLEERFWSKVDKKKDDECWEWKGAREKIGYGFLAGTRGEKSTKAHRLSYEFTYGEFDKKLCVCHKCDNPPCVNPKHLFLGSKGDNNRDRSSKGRGRENNQSGEKNANAKLKKENIMKIRELHKEGLSQQKIANMFGIKQPQVSRITRGTQWEE